MVCALRSSTSQRSLRGFRAEAFTPGRLTGIKASAGYAILPTPRRFRDRERVYNLFLRQLPAVNHHRIAGDKRRLF